MIDKSGWCFLKVFNGLHILMWFLSWFCTWRTLQYVGHDWAHGLRLYSIIPSSYQKNRRLLWICCRNPFPGRSLHRVFSFNVMRFIVKFQLVIETIMVKLSAGQWVHMEGRGGQRLLWSCVWSEAALDPTQVMGVDYAGYVSYSSTATMVVLHLLAVILYLCLFLYACKGDYLFEGEKRF